MQLREVQRNLEPESITKSKADLENSLKLISEIVDRIRRISRSLRPTILEDMGLSTGLKFLFNDFREYHNLEVQADVDDMEKSFSREHQILIYRIFQESLTNVTKHSEATKVTVAIKKQDGYVSFRMEDNGKGFDLQEVLKNSNKKRGVGLAALDERVRMMGGNLELWSHPGQGTRVQFTVPVDNPEV